MSIIVKKPSKQEKKQEKPILSKQTTFFDETEAAKPLWSLGWPRLEKLPEIHISFAEF